MAGRQDVSAKARSERPWHRWLAPAAIVRVAAGRPRGVGGRGEGRSRQEGQALSEYVVILGLMVGLILAVLATFTTPVALAFVRLARRLVVQLSS